MVPPTSSSARGSIQLMTTVGRTPRARQVTAASSMPIRMDQSASWTPAGMVPAPVPEEGHAEGLDETGGGQRAGQRQQRGAQRDQQVQQRAGERRRKQKGLEREPFGNEAVEGRKRRDRDAADEEEDRGPGHEVDQPAHLLHVPLVRGMEHRAGAHEEEPLEHGVVQGVVEPGDQREGGQRATCRRR